MPWVRTKRNRACPICGGHSGCESKTSDRGTIVICIRQSVGSVKSIQIAGFGTGYIHHLSETSSPSPIDRPPSFIAALETRSAAYSQLCNGWLEPHHQAYLSNIRGFLHPERLGYTTLSSYSTDRDIEAVNISKKARLTGVPGFWENDTGWHLAGPGGILMPIRRPDRSIAYCVINTEQAIENKLAGKPSGKAAYLWLSSSRYGGGILNPVSHVILRDPKRWIIVEGILKADLAAELWPEPWSFLGMPGVSAGMDDAVNQVRDADKILVAFDADWRVNEGVGLALKSLLRRLQTRLNDLDRVRLLIWPERAGKGIDDVLQAGRFNSLTAEEAGGII